MLRSGLKKELLQILEALQKLHHMGLVGQNYENTCSVLQDCQAAAIELGEKLEQNIEDNQTMVQILENYCESLFQLSQNYPFAEEEITVLDRLLQEEIQLLEQQQTKYQVVFFPYKASMWDSLESVWLACREDERCECRVVPIPYYRFDNTGKSEAVYCYEGQDFPNYVPVEDYREFSLEQECPDIAYIHNPYDKYNYVTSIHPDYYSYNLKKYVGKLVYIPYYVKAGTVSDSQKTLSVYPVMDYMIAQSQLFKDGFQGLPYYDKLLPLGSPKFDRVIRMNQQKNIPKDWQPVLAGKKTVMLNTSISCFLNHGEIMLKKLKAVFECFRELQDVVLIWRPHPLIEATIKSMRPQLLEGYKELLLYFEQQSTGILDRTPDITATVAVADAYIGEAASSVVHLFGAAGKPIFILDDFITEEFQEQQKRRIMISDMIEAKGKLWMTSLQYNGLFSLEDDWEKVQYLGRQNDQLTWTCSYSTFLQAEQKLYMAPYDTEKAGLYDLQKKKFFTFGSDHKKSIDAKFIAQYDYKIFYLLTYENAILEYNTKTEEWLRYDGIYSELNPNGNSRIPAFIWDMTVQKEFIWITSLNSGRVLRFDMKNQKSRVYQIMDDVQQFSGITCDDKHIYLAVSQSGDIISVHTESFEQKIYPMPDEIKVDYDENHATMAHVKLLNFDQWIVTAPFNSSKMVKISKESGETSFLADDFWNGTDTIANGYNPKGRGIVSFAKKTSDSELVVQRLSDCALARINVGTGAYCVTYPTMTEESFTKFMDGQDGFERLSVNDGYECRESAIFSLKAFLTKLVNGELEMIKDRQMKSLSSMAANLDGTCGQKVHEYMMQVVEQQI